MMIGLKTLLFCLSLLQAQNKDEWQPLFNGKNLRGWRVLIDSAEFEIVDGAIVGVSKLNTPNTFLVTEKNYGDFLATFKCLG